MIFSQATGGLGNQMYNYAMGYALAKKYSEEMILDISAYKYSPRPFVLDSMKLSYPCKSIFAPLANNKLGRMFARAIRIAYTNRYGVCKWIKEQESSRNKYFDYDFSHRSSLYIEGYWQNYRYFDDYREELWDEFAPKDDILSVECNELMSRIGSEESVAIHIRRGDYEAAWCIGDDYYSKALSLISERVSLAKYYIFCEDLDVANEYIKLLPNATYVTKKYQLNDIEEFFVMSACKHQIIANSTYSWWAAYLNRNRRKCVVAPVTMQWGKEYYPLDWKIVEI